MSFFKKNKYRPAFARLFAVCFGFMVAFSIYLHDHEFEHIEADEDCAPCHWTQTSVSLEMDTPDLTVETWARSISLPSARITFQKLLHTYFGRSPPLFS
jgi:hypothetical protein